MSDPGYFAWAAPTQINDAMSRASDNRRTFTNGFVRRSALLPPRAVALFHAVATTATVRIKPLATNSATLIDRTVDDSV